jgi:hypothetical protein
MSRVINARKELLHWKYDLRPFIAKDVQMGNRGGRKFWCFRGQRPGNQIPSEVSLPKAHRVGTHKSGFRVWLETSDSMDGLTTSP